jgi:pilus assembly protein CpaB
VSSTQVLDVNSLAESRAFALARLPLSRLLPALLALLVAVAVVLTAPQRLGHSGLLSRQAPASPVGEVEQVVVVAVDVPRGTTLTADMVKVRDWPKNLVPSGALTRVEDAVGRTCLTRLVPDEPVQDARLAPKGAPGGIGPLIPRGMRAVTIQTPNVSVGVGGFVLPRSKVDVLLTVRKEYGGAATTLLQNVEVLAVNDRVEPPADNKMDPKDLRSVTLLVTPPRPPCWPWPRTRARSGCPSATPRTRRSATPRR